MIPSAVTVLASGSDLAAIRADALRQGRELFGPAAGYLAARHITDGDVVQEHGEFRARVEVRLIPPPPPPSRLDTARPYVATGVVTVFLIACAVLFAWGGSLTAAAVPAAMAAIFLLASRRVLRRRARRLRGAS